MSFDKQYPNRKDRRKPYRGSKAVDRSCRNRGSCGYCLRSRTINQARTDASVQLAMQAMDDFDGAED